MLYRIDYEHFLTHMIDYFTRAELLSLHYVIISNNILNTNKYPYVVKESALYPDRDTVMDYHNFKNYEKFKIKYFDELKVYHGLIYNSLFLPLFKHKSVVIICRKIENFIIDALCEYILEKFKVGSIDLNKLFSEGFIDNIIYPSDRDSMREVKHEMVKQMSKEMYEENLRTNSGRLKILNHMKLKHKLKFLKKLGYNPDKIKESEIDQIIIDDWVNQIENNIKPF